MKNYVKLKDGVYMTNEIRGQAFVYFWYGQKAINKDEILKEGDTIEELCDEYVRVNKDIHEYLASEDMPTRYEGSEIYGAIWTDKGLIYVAKINDKGELELIHPFKHPFM